MDISDIVIMPSIFAFPILKISDFCEVFTRNNIKAIHVDIMDGHFVPTLFGSSKLVRELKEQFPFSIDTHLMISNPEMKIEEFLLAGSDSLSFHIEATNDSLYLINKIKKYGTKAGIAINPSTNVSSLYPLLYHVDYILVLSVNPGREGEVFLQDSVDRIRKITKFKEDNNLSFEIKIDGKIDNQSIKELKGIGIKYFVSGGYLVDDFEHKYLNMISLFK